MVLTWPPRKMRATIATIAIRARISAYSARPWPSWSRRKNEMRASMWDMSSWDLLSSGFTDLGPWDAHSTGKPTLLSNVRPPPCDGHEETAGARRPRRSYPISSERRLDRRTDLAQDGADLAAQEDEGDDRDDRDQGEDQRVLRETLALLVTTKRGEERIEERHVAASWMSTHPQTRAAPIYGRALRNALARWSGSV